MDVMEKQKKKKNTNCELYDYMLKKSLLYVYYAVLNHDYNII